MRIETWVMRVALDTAPHFGVPGEPASIMTCNPFCFLTNQCRHLCGYSLSCAWWTSAARDFAKTAMHGFGSYQKSFGLLNAGQGLQEVRLSVFKLPLASAASFEGKAPMHVPRLHNWS